MRSVSWKARVSAVALIVVLLAPAAMAADASAAPAPSLWAEFVIWLTGGSDLSADATVDEEGFTAWWMARIGIPNG